MKTEIVHMNGYNAKLYRTDKYTVYLASFMFQMEFNKHDMYLMDVLLEYLLSTNPKYKTREKLGKAFRENYGMKIFIHNYSRGNKMFIELRLNLIDPTVVKEEYLEKALEFAHDIFFNINVLDNKLDQKTLTTTKNIMIDELGSSLSNPQHRAYNLFNKEVYKDSYITIDYIDSKEEYAALLNSYSDRDIINMHTKLINECFIGCNLMGNYRKKDIDLLKKYFPFKSHKIKLNYKYHMDLSKVKKNIVHSDSKISATYLIVVYKVRDYKPNEGEKFNAINNVLNSTGMLLHKVLRDEKKLVYSAYSDFNGKKGIFEISTEISKENIDATIEAIDEVFKMLENRELIKTLLKKGKKEVKLSNYVEDENYSRVFSRLVNEHFKMSDTLENITNRYMSLNVRDILEALSRIEKVTTFVYRGDKQ